MTTKNSALKSINANIKAIATQAGKLDTLAHSTVALILKNGEETRHYDRVTALLNVLAFNPRLQKEILQAFAGKVPHSIRTVNGEYKLGKRDDTLIKSADELAEIEATRAANREKTTEATRAKRDADKAKLAQFDDVVKKSLEQELTVADLTTKLAAANAEIARLRAKVSKLQNAIGEPTRRAIAKGKVIPMPAEESEAQAA